MLTWKIWKEGAQSWDESLSRFPDATVYQSFAWGEHRGHCGWTPYRFAAFDGTHIISMAQVLARHFPLGIALAWMPSGPIGRKDTWNASFRSLIKKTVGARYLYCRLNATQESTPEDESLLKSLGWKRSTAPLLSGLSLAYDPAVSESEREAQTSRNWRHNLRRSQKYGNLVRVWSNPDPDAMLEIYGAMELHKNLSQQISRPALVSMLETFGPRCVVVRCDDAQGRLLAFRGALIFAEKGWDIFAAASPEARKVYASHAAFWELMQQCAARGVRWYDMSGADPVGNKGVYDFKKGTGAREFSYLGEWDWASPFLFRRVANALIKRRAGAVA